MESNSIGGPFGVGLLDLLGDALCDAGLEAPWLGADEALWLEALEGSVDAPADVVGSAAGELPAVSGR
jgi:hypothetical protein